MVSIIDKTRQTCTKATHSILPCSSGMENESPKREGHKTMSSCDETNKNKNKKTKKMIETIHPIRTSSSFHSKGSASSAESSFDYYSVTSKTTKKTYDGGLSAMQMDMSEDSWIADDPFLQAENFTEVNKSEYAKFVTSKRKGSIDDGCSSGAPSGKEKKTNHHEETKLPPEVVVSQTYEEQDLPQPMEEEEKDNEGEDHDHEDEVEFLMTTQLLPAPFSRTSSSSSLRRELVSDETSSSDEFKPLPVHSSSSSSTASSSSSPEDEDAMMMVRTISPFPVVRNKSPMPYGHHDPYMNSHRVTPQRGDVPVWTAATTPTGASTSTARQSPYQGQVSCGASTMMSIHDMVPVPPLTQSFSPMTMQKVSPPPPLLRPPMQRQLSTPVMKSSASPMTGTTTEPLSPIMKSAPIYPLPSPHLVDIPMNDDEEILPQEYVPGPWSVIIGKDKRSLDAPGNKRLRAIVEIFLDKYAQCGSKKQNADIKSRIITDIMSTIIAGHQGDDPDREVIGAFITCKHGRWYEVSHKRAREKIGRMLRELLHTQYKSSSKQKRATLKSKRRQTL